MNKNKFNIGDLVKFENDKDSDAGNVMSISFDGNEWSYKISSKEVDLDKKEIINGVKFGKEVELVAVEKVNE